MINEIWLIILSNNYKNILLQPYELRDKYRVSLYLFTEYLQFASRSLFISL